MRPIDGAADDLAGRTSGMGRSDPATKEETDDAAAFWDKAADKYSKKPVKDVASYETTLEGTRKHLSASDDVLELGCRTGSTALPPSPPRRFVVARKD